MDVSKEDKESESAEDKIPPSRKALVSEVKRVHHKIALHGKQTKKQTTTNRNKRKQGKGASSSVMLRRLGSFNNPLPRPSRRYTRNLFVLSCQFIRYIYLFSISFYSHNASLNFVMCCMHMHAPHDCEHVSMPVC